MEDINKAMRNIAIKQWRKPLEKKKFELIKKEKC